MATPETKALGLQPMFNVLLKKLKFTQYPELLYKKLPEPAKKMILKRLMGLENSVINKIKENNYQFCLLSTMPRSGTWMMKFFFCAYNCYLANRDVTDDNIPSFNLYPEIKIAQYLDHAVFPDFQLIYHGKHRQKWDDLFFFVKGYNNGRYFLKENRQYFSPTQNSNVRIAYIFRNPLDQAVSFFDHTKKHKDERQRYYLVDGKKKYFLNAKDFLKNVGLNSYLKQFLSFYLMKDEFQKSLLMIPYELLINDPRIYFKQLLQFFGHEIDSDLKARSFDDALSFVAIENLQEFEKTLGHALGNDQKERSESHMRGGSIGKWKKYFDENDLKYIEDKLKEFDLPLDFFKLE